MKRANLFAAVAFACLGACSDRPIGTGSGRTSGSESVTGTTGEGTGVTATTGAPVTVTSTADETEMDPDSATAGACGGEDPAPTPDNPCGLSAVYFAAGLSTLDPLAECQLTALAECTETLRSFSYILEAHTSSGEVDTEEESILLSEQRGVAVRNFLIDQGVDGWQLQVIAKGNLEATPPSDSTDQRVELWFGL